VGPGAGRGAGTGRAGDDAVSVRVLVVDDSAFMRQLLVRLLSSSPDVEVAGTARDGVEAVEETLRLRPDVVTLDVEMPRLDGLGALRRLMRVCPTPVVMVSSLTQAQAEATIQALVAGAVDFVAKPANPVDMARVAGELTAKVLAAARVRLEGRGGPPSGRPRSAEEMRRPAAGGAVPSPAGPPRRLVVIGCSTGGPQALRTLLPALPEALPAAVVVVQHMPAGFTRALAERLDRECRLRVREAAEGDPLQAGTVLVAPGGHHVVLGHDGAVHLDDGPPRHGVRPAVDATLESAATRFDGGTVAAILTGMGSDGTAGARLIREAGGVVLAEDERTCVVYGMPRSVVEAGFADRVVPLDAMADAIVGAVAGLAGREGGVRARPADLDSRRA
jgi:two-component system chemotaxis response regulator CheB